MNRISKWLTPKLSRSEAAEDEPSNADVIKPDINESTIDIFIGDEVANSMQNQVPAKDVLMPDIYSDEHVATVPNLKTLDQPSLEDGESAGINPYDTGILQKK